MPQGYIGTKRGTGQMQILGIIAGIVVAVLVGVANGWMYSAFEFDITKILLIVVPVGAFLVGYPSGFALSFVSSMRGSKPGFVVAAIMFGFACVVGALTMLSYHYFAYLQEGAPSLGVGFSEYHTHVLNSYSISFRGSSDFALGDWSAVLGYSEYAAATLGALSGWITGYAASRTAGGVGSLPSYYDDIADLLIAVATVDGKARQSEMTMAAKGLALTMDAWFEGPGKNLSDQLSKLAAQKIELAVEKLQNQEPRPIDIITQAIPNNERTLSWLIGAAAWSVAAADADVSPREKTKLQRILLLIGLKESDWPKIEELGMVQVASHIGALNEATPLKVARVELEHVTTKQVDDAEMPGSTIGAIGLVRSGAGTIYRVGYLLHCIFAKTGPLSGEVFHSIEIWADKVSTTNEEDENTQIDSFSVYGFEFEVGKPRVNRHDKVTSALLLPDEYPSIADSIEKWIRKGVHIKFRLSNGIDSFQALFPGADINSDTQNALEEYAAHKRRLSSVQ